jgi:hypothetical protein
VPVAWSAETQLELSSQACHQAHHLKLLGAIRLTLEQGEQLGVEVVIEEGGYFVRAWVALRVVPHQVC